MVAPSSSPAPAPAPANGLAAEPPLPSATPATQGPSNRVDVIDSDHGRILCVADVRGKISLLNDLAREHRAQAIVHSGDFGFYEPSSLDRISDRTLRHLIQYTALVTPAFRSTLLATPAAPASRLPALLASPPPDALTSTVSSFALSEFPALLSGKLKLDVPVYTVWGACEDVAVLERIRAGDPAYAVHNLTVLDEATTRCLVVGGVRLRLFGLGGAIVPHKLFDNGEGGATIAGAQGTMWTTVLQIGEIVDTAQRCYDPSETRLLVTHASPGREGLLSQLALVLKADLTVSAGLHFRYGVSYNEFSVQHDQDTFRAKLHQAKSSFNEIFDTVKDQVKAVIDDQQSVLLDNALAVANRIPVAQTPGATHTEEAAWKNSWNWNLPDAAYGSLVLDVREGRVGAELKSQGFNFSYRQQQQQPQQRPISAGGPAPSASSVRPNQPAHVNTNQNPPFRPGFAGGKPPANNAQESPKTSGTPLPNHPVTKSGGYPGKPNHSNQPSSGTPGAVTAPTASTPSHTPHGSGHGLNHGRNKSGHRSREEKTHKSDDAAANGGSQSVTVTRNSTPTVTENAQSSALTGSEAESGSKSREHTPKFKKKPLHRNKRGVGSRSDAERSHADDKSEAEKSAGSRPTTSMSNKVQSVVSESEAVTVSPPTKAAVAGEVSVTEASANESGGGRRGGRGGGDRGGGNRGRGRGGRGRGGNGFNSSGHGSEAMTQPSSSTNTATAPITSPGNGGKGRGGYSGGNAIVGAALAGVGIQSKTTPNTPTQS